MKKTIVKQDGTKEVLEGTPEEIAELERRIRQEPIREEPKKPGLLTEDDQKLLDSQDWVKKILEEYYKQKQYPGGLLPDPIDDVRYGYGQWRWQHTPECEIEVAKRGWWCVNPPRCTCGLFLYPGQRYSPILDIQTMPYKYTFTTTTNWTCPDCGALLGGLNNQNICNCARGADGKVLEGSNVEARKAYKELIESVERTEINFDYPRQTVLGKFF